MDRSKYLFVCGCPRSGTTAMMNLLNSHHSIALGVERYKFYANSKNIHQLKKYRFEANLFFDIQQKETNLNPSHRSWNSRWKPIYDDLKRKFNNSNLIVGDKYPYYYHFYEELDRAFDRPKWIFLLRNIHEIASSYNSRASHPKDRWSKSHNYRYAVKDWNDALTQTWKYLENNSQRLLICEYEKVFYGKVEYFDRILDFLDIGADITMNKFYQEMTTDWQKRLLKPKQLNFEQIKYIDLNADWILRDRLVKKYGCLSKHL